MIEEYFGKGKNDFKFAIFIINKNNSIYGKLKIHSLHKYGYISQVINQNKIS